MEQEPLMQVRQSLGVSQQALARRAGLTKLTIQNLEHKRCFPKMDNAYRILGAINAIRREQGLPDLRLDELEWGISKEK